jgi:hypothetical protein
LISRRPSSRTSQPIAASFAIAFFFVWQLPGSHEIDRREAVRRTLNRVGHAGAVSAAHPTALRDHRRNRWSRCRELSHIK